MPLAAGTRLGAYEILDPLGAGGMGEVYRARDTRLDRRVALKVLPRHIGRDPWAVERFRREALTVASLNHPNIAILHGFEELPDGTTALVMELVEGETLAARLARGRIGVEEALQIGAQIAEALEVAHAHDVVHRDVKPGNVMIGPRGLVKVLDFGLAHRTRGPAPLSPAGAQGAGGDPLSTPPSSASREDAPTLAVGPRRPGMPGGAEATSDSGSGEGMTVGTPGYMSPEQVRSQATDARTDVFAFGSLLYECLTGEHAFAGRTMLETMQATLAEPLNLAALEGRGLARVQALVARCLEKEPGARPPDMRTVRLEIEEVLGIRRAAALREGTAYATPNNLPAPATSFIGREGVLRECERLLEGTRLLTLLGMGGSGKTRVAQRIAETALERHPDGVWLVNLAPVADASHVPDVTAAALEVEDEPGRSPLEALLQRVRNQRMLFVVDNCEHVLDGVRGLVTALLSGCPRARVLTTSREPLAVEGETIFPMPTLTVPAAETTDVTRLAHVESARLFVERAAANDPTFELTAANAGDVAEICRRLDGIPLALELAAARVRLLGVEQVRARLGDRFKLLARPGAGGPSRQQTVLATIQWSWDHLLPPERDLMRRLAVFTGGWTLDRAAAVVSDARDEFAVLDLLTRLVERSLVVIERRASTPTRYRFLESVHQFALERLQAGPDLLEMRERHLATYLELARSANATMMGRGIAQQLAELVPEEDNILAALEWCDHAAEGGRKGLVLAEQFYRFWSVRGRYALALRVMEEALRRDAGNPLGAERARALTRAAGGSLSLGDIETSRARLEESLAFWRSSEDKSGLPAVLAGLGVVAMFQVRFEDALRLAEEGLGLYQATGQRRGVAMALHNVGTIEFVLGRPDHGRANFEKALALFRETGDVATEALCLSALSTARLRCGDREAAHEAMRECLDRLERLESPREAVFALEAVAELLVADDRVVEAARLLGASDAARVSHKLPLMPSERVEVERLSARAREAVDADEFEQAAARGRGFTLSAALAEARLAIAGPAS